MAEALSLLNQSLKKTLSDEPAKHRIQKIQFLTPRPAQRTKEAVAL
jgi:hypothetical protein